MFIKYDYDMALVNVKVCLGEELNQARAEDAYIVLKELPTMDMIKLKQVQEEGEVELFEYFRKILPGIIVDHNFYQTASEKMSNEEVVDFIYQKLVLTSKVITEYASSAFFTQGNKASEN